MNTAPDRDTFAIVAHTMIFRGTELLLLRRAGTGFMDGHHTLPGGHRQNGETVVDAAVRECREELGITVEALRPVVVMPYREGANFVFEALDWHGEPIIAEPEKCDALAFAAPPALPVPTAPFVARALRCRQRAEWYEEKPSAAARLAPARKDV